MMINPQRDYYQQYYYLASVNTYKTGFSSQFSFPKHGSEALIPLAMVQQHLVASKPRSKPSQNLQTNVPLPKDPLKVLPAHVQQVCFLTIVIKKHGSETLGLSRHGSKALGSKLDN